VADFPSAADDVRLYSRRSIGVQAVNKADGSVAWQEERTNAGVFTPFVTPGLVVVSSPTRALDPATGALRWRHKETYAFEQAVGTADLVVLLAELRKPRRYGLVVVDAASGQLVARAAVRTDGLAQLPRLWSVHAFGGVVSLGASPLPTPLTDETLQAAFETYAAQFKADADGAVPEAPTVPCRVGGAGALMVVAGHGSEVVGYRVVGHATTRLWAARAGGNECRYPDLRPLAVSGGLVAFAENDAASSRLRAVDAASGADVWQAPTPAVFEIHPFSQGFWVASSRSVALYGADGAKRWQTATNGPHALADQDSVYLRSDLKLERIRPLGGGAATVDAGGPPDLGPALRVRWAWRFQDTLGDTRRPLIPHDGKRLLVAGRVAAAALDLATGRVQWLDRGAAPSEDAGLHAGRWYLGTKAVAPASGERLADSTWRPGVPSTMTREGYHIPESGDGEIMAIAHPTDPREIGQAGDGCWHASATRLLYHLSPVDPRGAAGEFAAAVASGAQQECPCGLAERDGALFYVSAARRAVVAVDADTMKERWSRPVAGDCTGAPILRLSQTLYVRLSSGVAALNAADGALRWTARIALSEEAHAVPHPDGLVVADGRQLTLSRREDGRQAWTAAFRHAVGPPTVDGRSLFFGTAGGEVYALEPGEAAAPGGE
jgi:outer membrane protein assembly factor BamB